MRRILFAVLFSLVLHISPAQAEAYEMSRILLPPVLDSAGYKSPELNAAVLDKVKDHLKFPRYDVIPAELPAAKGQPDKAWLEKQVTDAKVDGIIVMEIKELRTYTRIVSDDEIIDETFLSMVLHFFDPKSGQSGKIKAERSITETASVFSGAKAASVDTTVELLKRLEKVFPRTFAAPSR